MINHPSSEQRNQYPARDAPQATFITAAQLPMTTNTNVNAMPDISDEELLAMALAFEKKHGLQ